MSTMNSLAALAFFGLTLVALPGVAQQPSEELSAKALFYSATGALLSVPSKSADPTKAVAQSPRNVSPVLALRASVLLASVDGGTREVKPSYQFRSGDRLKLAFTTNRPGYFYLAAVGSSGKVQVLAPRRGEPAALKAGYRYVYPAAQNAYFKLDGREGKEVLWAVMADEPLHAINLGDGRIAQPEGVDGPAPAVQAVAYAGDEFAGKDLVFEEDAEAAYVSLRPTADRRNDQGPRPRVIVKLVLDHK